MTHLHGRARFDVGVEGVVVGIGERSREGQLVAPGWPGRRDAGAIMWRHGGDDIGRGDLRGEESAHGKGWMVRWYWCVRAVEAQGHHRARRVRPWRGEVNACATRRAPSRRRDG